MRVSTIHARGQGTRQLSSSVSHGAFRWETRVGPVAFRNAYEGGHGVTDVTPPGSEAVDTAARPAIDQASLQRYLVSIFPAQAEAFWDLERGRFLYERSQTTSLELL